MTHPLDRTRRPFGDTLDFGDRETVPAELIPETRLPRPDVTYLEGRYAWGPFVEAWKRFMGIAA